MFSALVILESVFIIIENYSKTSVLQHHSLDMPCQLGAQERIVGIVDSWKKNLGDYMTEVFPGIDKLPTPTAGFAKSKWQARPLGRPFAAVV